MPACSFMIMACLLMHWPPADALAHFACLLQAGSSLKFGAEDQKALVMGLTMHERGKASMAKVG